MKMNFKNTLLLAGLFSIAAGARAQLGEIDVHGFISQGYTLSSKYNFQTMDSKDGAFEFNELALNFSTELSDEIRAGLQIMSRDFGDVGNNQIVVDWAYGDYAFSDYLGLRAGRVKVPVGLYNRTRDVDLVRTSVLLPQSVYNETFRDFQSAINGLEVYGLLPLSDMGNLLYTLQAGALEVDAANSGIRARFEAEGYTTGVPGVESVRGINRVDADTAYNAALVWLTPLDGLRVGTTVNSFKFSTEGTVFNNLLAPFPLPMGVQSERAVIYTGSAEYMRGDWVFAAEGIYTWYDMDLTLNAAPAGTLGFKVAGGYGSASYRLNELIELGSYYSYIRNMDDDATGHDVALSVRFDLTDS